MPRPFRLFASHKRPRVLVKRSRLGGDLSSFLRGLQATVKGFSLPKLLKRAKAAFTRDLEDPQPYEPRADYEAYTLPYNPAMGQRELSTDDFYRVGETPAEFRATLPEVPVEPRAYGPPRETGPWPGLRELAPAAPTREEAQAANLEARLRSFGVPVSSVRVKPKPKARDRWQEEKNRRAAITKALNRSTYADIGKGGRSRRAGFL